jgi:ZIP family zinc transporter
MSPAPMGSVLVVAFLTGTVTLLGGTLALRFGTALDLLLGFSSGSIIGVALFDLFPGALDLAGERHSTLSITSAIAAGFALYLTADRASFIFAAESSGRRHFAPAALTLHSFLDGLGIGLAFHVSLGAGVIVAIGVLAHDLIDGANTIVVTLAGGARRSIARSWLVADAVAPSVGILLASAIAIPAFSLALALGLFGGFFLYVGASELLPRSHSRSPRMSTIAATVAGLTFICAVTWLAGGRG